MYGCIYTHAVYCEILSFIMAHFRHILQVLEDNCDMHYKFSMMKNPGSFNNTGRYH